MRGSLTANTQGGAVSSPRPIHRRSPIHSPVSRRPSTVRGHRLGSLAFKPSIAWQVSPNHRLTTHDQPHAPLGQPIKGSIKGSESLTYFEAKDSDPLIDPLIEREIRMLDNDALDPYFRATIQATEEAVVNAMLAADTMVGADGLRVMGLPGERLVDVLRKYKRMP